MKASKKTIAIVIATLVLVVSAVTGVVMYLNDDGTARAGFDENEPVISQGNNNAGTEENNNQGEENTAVPGEEEPGTLPEAGENGEQGTTTGTTPTTPAGTTGTTTDTTVPNEEYVTERIEEVERQITEDLLVGWTPIRINSAYSTLNLGIVKPELSTLKISATEDENNSISAGDILTYVLAVKNDGKEDITGVNVSDIIPDQTTLIEKSIYGEGTYNKELNKINWKVDVKAGEIVAVGFAVIVNEGATGNIENVGTINGEETEKTVNPVIESSKISEIFRDEQKVEEPANIGDKLTYTVTVKNTGTIPAQAFVQDTVPVNTELVSDIVLAGETIDEATMVAGKTITVAPGETEKLTFTVEIKAVDGTIENIAKVGGTTPTDLVKTANLEMSKTVSATGEEGTYAENITLGADETAYFRIELKNTGSEALELELTDVMGETTLELFDGQEKVTGTITVAANETKVLTATYTMQQSDIDNQEVLTNTIVATDKDNKIPGGEDTATVTPEDPAPSLYVEKTTSTVTPVDSADFAIEQPITDKTRVRPGDVITYTIYVKNDGNITLYNVDVTDSLDVKYNGTLIKASKGDVIEQIATFAPGAEKTYHVKYTVTQADIDAGKPITNVAIATDGTTTGKDKTDKDIPVNPDVTVSGSKTWVDYKNQEGTRPEKITVKLMNGTEEVASATVSGPDWTYEFTNLAKYDAGNNVIAYTVVEEGATGYTPDYTDRTVATNGDITANITNTLNYTPTVSLSGTKSWVDYDNQEKTRPDNIEIEVISSDSTDTTERKATIGKKADETYDWTYTFTGLPKYDAKNNVISYSVEETGVDTDKYRATYGEVKVDETTGDITANITNTLNYTPTVSLRGTKSWVDYDNQEKTRPDNIEIEVISSDSTDTTERKATIGKKADETYDWTYTFTGLPKYDAENNVISYSVEETGVNTNKYRATYGEVEVDETTGDITANITNTLNYTPTVSLSGTKSWVDYDNQEKTRPENIEIEVISSDSTDTTERKATIGKKADETYDWTYTFTGLPKYDAENNVISYSVEETGVNTNKYRVTYGEVEVDETTGDITANITNTLNYTPTVSLSGTKSWVDYDNQEETRPENIEIEVISSDSTDTTERKATIGKKADETYDWTYTFTGLPKYDAKNNVISYSVEETGVDTNKYRATYGEVEVDETTGDITANITNTLNYTPTVSLRGTKSWVDYDNQEETRPENIEIEVISSDSTDTTERKATIGKKADETYDWTYTFTGLPKYDAENNVISYSVEETGVNTNKYRVTYGEVEVDETTGDITANITNTLNYTPTVSLRGTKSWVDYDNQEETRPENIEIEVISSDSTDTTERKTTIGKKADETYDWTYTFTGLPKYDAENNVISYSVEETGVNTNKYRVTYGEVEVDETTGDITANITNTLNYTPTVSLSGTKSWVDYDNQEKTRPENIEIEVISSDSTDTTERKATIGKKADETYDWTYTFTGLPKYDAENNVISYSVEETGVNTNKYRVTYGEVEVDETTGDITANITNTLNYTPTVSLRGTKSWVDYDNQEETRPENIEIEVISSDSTDTTERKTTIGKKADETYDWTYTFTGLPKYDAENNVISYSVEETGVNTNKYRATYGEVEVDETTGDITANITNTLNYTPTVTLTGTKTWNDNSNQDGLRPDNITIAVISSDTTDRTERLTTIGKKVDGTYDWTYTFTGLPKYDADNNVISYTVSETGVDKNYYTSQVSTPVVSNNGDITVNIINTHETEKITISGTKTWNDNNNQDGYRPDNITVKLMNGGTVVDTITIGKKADGTYDWTYSFTKDRRANGEIISYTVVEEMTTNSDKYTPDYTDRTVADNGDITANITNTHKPETVTISGTKTWVGDNNGLNGSRPANITVKLMNGSTKVASVTVTPDADGNWKYTFEPQPKFANGKAIKYTVAEISVEGYTAKVNGYNITNTYIKPELTKVKSSTAGEKVNLGEEITYKIKTTNSGKTNVKSVIVTDAVPAYTTLVTGSISAGGTLGSDGKTITWNIGDLAVGASKEVSFKVTVNTTADTIGKTISNTGYVNGEKTNTVDTVVDKKVTVSTVEYPVKAIDVVLVLDTSTSMEDYSRIDNAKSAACKFIDGIFPSGTSNTGSTVTVITFNNTATKLGKATDTKSATTLKNQINAIKLKTGDDSVGTHIYNALTLTNTELQKLSNTNKFVVFLSDGAPSSPFSIWKNQKGNETYYENELFTTNTEANITAAANAVKANSTGVYSIGFGIDKLSTEREYWSNYSVCTSGRSCKKEHIKVDGTKYHWESCNSYAKRVLKDIIADKFVPATETTPEKKYYYEATDSATSIVNQFMTVLQEISTKKRTVTATSSTVKITVTETINTNKDIKIIIDGVKHPCKLSDLPQYGVSYNATENYFTWDITNYATSTLKLEYTIK